MTIETITRTLDYVTEFQTGSAAAPRPDMPEVSEFDQFEELAGKLVQVPKSEVDERREQES